MPDTFHKKLLVLPQTKVRLVAMGCIGNIMKYLVLGLAVMLCSACTNYNLFFNDTALYTPAPLYLDFSLPDQNLETCLVQHVEDGEIKSPRELIQVNCSYAGITDVEGLTQFSRIENLSLKGNALENIEPLFRLVNLRVLDISETEISCQDIARLEELPLDQVISSENC